MAVYSVAQAAEAANLAPSAIRDYCRGRADLDRGKDFFVKRSGKYRRNLLITERGLARLSTRQYRTIDGPRRKHIALILSAPSLVDLIAGVNGREAKLRFKSLLIHVMLDYLDSPCSVSACPCMAHRLGLPTAQELMDAGLYGGVQGGKGGRKK